MGVLKREEWGWLCDGDGRSEGASGNRGCEGMGCDGDGDGWKAQGTVGSFSGSETG